MKQFLFTFGLPDGNLCLTSDNRDIVVEGVTYTAASIDCKEIVFDLKEIVGEVNISIPWSQTAGLQEHLRNPLDSPISVSIHVLSLPAGSTHTAFEGFVNSFKLSKGSLDLGCLSFVEYARDNFPRMVITRLCNHQLYSELCGAPRSNFTDVLTISSISSDRLRIRVQEIVRTGFQWYRYGYVRLGKSYRYVVSSTDSNRNIDVLHPVPLNWVAGVTIEAVAGCDKKMETCKNKFGNFARYLGFPHAPYESIRLTGLRSSEQRVSGKKK